VSRVILALGQQVQQVLRETKVIQGLKEPPECKARSEIQDL